MKLQFSLPIFTAIVFLISNQNAIAQTYIPSNRTPIADGTMNTQVSGSGNQFNITGGVNKGQTLFHSFTDFSVPTNGTANFLNSANPRDIITRVTGTNFSDINGLINSNGANFFLINPNGITFGTGAQLNVGRAFIATSAEGINLVDGTGRSFTFGKSGAGDAPLLSVNSSVLFNPSQLLMGGISGQINNFGTLQTNNTSQYIGLIGGNVTFDGGKIFAPGGRVDLGGLNSAGTVTITSDGLVYGGSIPTRGNATLNNGAVVSVRAAENLDTVNTFFNNATAPGSSVNISANNIDLIDSGTKSNTEPAAIDAGLEKNSGAYTTPGGNISFNATGKVTLDNSYIKNTLRAGATGNIDGIKINANAVEIKNDSLISTVLAGSGNVGNITISSSGDINLTNDGVISSDNTQGNGNTGNINIKSGRNINLIDRSYISSDNVKGTGNTGNIEIQTTGNINIIESSYISSDNLEGTGDSGNIDLKTPGNINVVGTNDMSLLDEKQNAALSFISTILRGKGSTGKITLDAQGDISFSNRSSVFSTIGKTGEGNSQGIEIKNARDLSLNNKGSIITSNIGGVGNAGNIDLKNIGNLTVANLSFIAADIGENSRGNAGNISIQATGNIKIFGFDSQSRLLPTNSLTFSSISSSTYGNGDAGKISIDTAGDIEIANQGSISTTITNTGQGNSGGVEIKNAGNLRIVNNSFVNSANLGGKGNAGNIDIKTRGKIELIGRDPQSQLARDYPNLFATVKLAAISSDSFGEGKAANISTSTYRINLDKGQIFSTGTSVGGGDISLIISDILLLRNNSFIATNSSSSDPNNNGGNITINSPLIVAISPISGIAANAVSGNGGRVSISSQGLFGIEYVPRERQSSFSGNFITSSSQFGRDGAVNINTPGADPGRDSTELPNVPNDASNQISQACGASTRNNKLILAGRGGLPANADDPLTADVVWQDPRATSSQPAASNAPTNQLTPPAVGMVFDGKGKATLVAANTQAQPGTKAICPQAGK